MPHTSQLLPGCGGDGRDRRLGGEAGVGRQRADGRVERRAGGAGRPAGWGGGRRRLVRRRNKKRHVPSLRPNERPNDRQFIGAEELLPPQTGHGLRLVARPYLRMRAVSDGLGRCRSYPIVVKGQPISGQIKPNACALCNNTPQIEKRGDCDIPELGSAADADAKRWMADMVIAVYSYSFGNYRRELDSILRGPSESVMDHHESYDWFFFTDMASHRKKLWKMGFRVVLVPPGGEAAMHTAVEASRTNASHNLTSSRSRLLTKWFKFGHIPSVLRHYDYMIHVDASVYSRNENQYAIPQAAQTRALIASQRGAVFFAGTHPVRHTVSEEMEITGNKTWEVRSHLLTFKHAMEREFRQGILEDVPLISAGCWIRKLGNGTSDLDRALKSTFAAMIEYGLRRDQNVLSVMLLRWLRPSAAARVIRAKGVFVEYPQAERTPTPWPIVRGNGEGSTAL